MGDVTNISWTDHTYNYWWGCTKISPGCDHCYAAAFDRRTGGDHWGAGVSRRQIGDHTRNAPYRWNRKAEREGIPRRVFCGSMMDWADNEVPGEWREGMWRVIRETPWLRWQMLTKRIGNVPRMLPPEWPVGYEHVGLMSTVVNQTEADRDIPKLESIPAVWRGLSIEPILGAIDISAALTRGNIHWVIAGGESGPSARPCDPEWIRSLRDQCLAAGVAFHFKQWGGVNKKVTGRVLDGREWNEFPQRKV